jgi:hypothetical protein
LNQQKRLMLRSRTKCGVSEARQQYDWSHPSRRPLLGLLRVRLL